MVTNVKVVDGPRHIGRVTQLDQMLVLEILARMRAFCAPPRRKLENSYSRFGFTRLGVPIIGLSVAYYYFRARANWFLAAATTCSGVKPNFFCSSFSGADAPNVFMPSVCPPVPT